jgi:hypothetical protein
MMCTHNCPDPRSCGHTCCTRRRRKKASSLSTYQSKGPSYNLRGKAGSQSLSDAADRVLLVSTEVRASEIRGAGMGLFAQTRIASDTTLGWYRGFLLTDKQTKVSESCDILKLRKKPWWVTTDLYEAGFINVDAAATETTRRHRLAYINSSKKSKQTDPSIPNITNVPNVAMKDNGEYRTILSVMVDDELLMAYDFGIDLEQDAKDEKDANDATDKMDKKDKKDEKDKKEKKDADMAAGAPRDARAEARNAVRVGNLSVPRSRLGVAITSS